MATDYGNFDRKIKRLDRLLLIVGIILKKAVSLDLLEV